MRRRDDRRRDREDRSRSRSPSNRRDGRKDNKRSNRDVSRSRSRSGSIEDRSRTNRFRRESPDKGGRNHNIRNKYYKDVKTEENILMMYKRKYAPVYQGSLIRE